MTKKPASKAAASENTMQVFREIGGWNGWNGKVAAGCWERLPARPQRARWDRL